MIGIIREWHPNYKSVLFLSRFQNNLHNLEEKLMDFMILVNLEENERIIPCLIF